MSDQIPLHELNKALFAAMLPETHGEKHAESAAPKGKGKAAKAAEPAPEAADQPQE
jgi:hypothetical protein